ncbi:MAG: hypothetical protein ACFCUR_21610 [Rhodomicrobiaceae bacterium]
MPLIVVAVLAGGVAIAAYRIVFPQPPQADYSQIGPGKATSGAMLAIDREEAELGVLAIYDVGRAEFQLKNTGREPVEISEMMNGDSYRLAHSKRRSRRARPEPPSENAPPPTDADVRELRKCCIFAPASRCTISPALTPKQVKEPRARIIRSNWMSS